MKAVRALLTEEQKRFPEDLAWKVTYDPTIFVTETIREVQKTLIEAFDAAQDEGAAQANTLERLAHHARLELRQVQLEIRVLRHSATLFLSSADLPPPARQDMQGAKSRSSVQIS